MIYCSKKCSAIDYSNRFKGSSNPHWKGGSLSKNCLFCQKEYKVIIASFKNSKFCSNNCKNSWNIGRKRIPVNKYTCLNCGIGFSCLGKHNGLCGGCWLKTHLSKKIEHKKYFCSICNFIEFNRKAKYCKSCKKYRALKLLKCEICGEKFWRRNSEVSKAIHHFCSMKCRNINIAERQKGDKSWLWRGGLTNENRLLRNSYLVSNWRKEVFKRDNYTCQDCKLHASLLPKSSLTADHIKPWALFPELRLELSNGRTLCRDCHRKTDTFGYKSLYHKKTLNIYGLPKKTTS